jgi:methylenetetrahydrofolate dehydrogenase (NADP+)/methenyltetrahydrofolate cyclohydrolase
MEELRGKAVAEAMKEIFTKQISQLKEKQIVPTLAVIRVGEREDDLAYERGIKARFSAVGAKVDVIAMDESVSQEDLETVFFQKNDDPHTHGILLFRPLPDHLDETPLKNGIHWQKDVDCMNPLSLSYIFSGEHFQDGKRGFPPCTAQAVMEILHYYQIPLSGQHVVVAGRSLVIGKPVSMLLLGENATVTICHSRTKNMKTLCQQADILVVCIGKAEIITKEYTHPGQIIIDVGINMKNGTLCGDVDYTSVSHMVKAITPVPGGVGSVTTSVLLKHTIMSAMKNEASI